MSTASAMTYTSLCSDIRLYSERSDAEFLAQIPRFIMMAENSIASKVRGLGMQKVVNGEMKAGEDTFAKPIRWRESVSFNYVFNKQRKMIFLRSYEFCRRVSPDSSETGNPRYYADYTSEYFLISPAPDTKYKFELFYYERPEPLSESNQTNWTTQNAPQLLLYAALLEAQPFLKNDARLSTFKALYDEAVLVIGEEAKRRAFDRSAGVREA